jgi:hypothetical protein
MKILLREDGFHVCDLSAKFCKDPRLDGMENKDGKAMTEYANMR